MRRLTNDLSSYVSASVSADGAPSLPCSRTVRAAFGWARPMRRITLLKSPPGRFDGMNGLEWTPINRIVYTGYHSRNWDLSWPDADGEVSDPLTAATTKGTQPSATVGVRLSTPLLLTERTTFGSSICRPGPRTTDEWPRGEGPPRAQGTASG